VSRLVVDRDRCVGSGTCEVLAPEVFEVDDDGVLALLRPEPGDADLPHVRDAVQGCPTRALSLVDRVPEQSPDSRG
jgi:ferredoxin